MNYLDKDDLYGLIKGCTRDYTEEKKWKIILGKGFRKFEDYYLQFIYQKYASTPCIEVLIHSYTDPDVDDTDGSDFLDEHDFDLYFHNVAKNKTPLDCVEVNDNFIENLKEMFDFLFTEEDLYNPKDLCKAFLTVVGESAVWRVLVEDHEEQRILFEERQKNKHILDRDALYGLIKGCTHDYDYMEKNTWGPILGLRGYLKFREYFLEFQVLKGGLNPTIKVLIHNYTNPKQGVDERFYFEIRTFIFTFNNIDENKRPDECIDVDHNLVEYINKNFDFLFTKEDKYSPLDLCVAFFDVLSESKTWRSLFKEKDQEEMAKNEHQ